MKYIPMIVTIGMTIFKFFLIKDYFSVILEFSDLWSIVFAVVLSPAPIASQILGVLGAHDVWGWSWLLAIVVMAIPIPFNIPAWIRQSKEEAEAERKKEAEQKDKHRPY